MLRNSKFLWLATPILLAALSSAPLAAVELRYSPDDQSIPLGGNGSLSIMLDEPLDLRTIEVRVRFDPAILASLGGNPGHLFAATGCLLFNPFDDSTPGEWYGAAVILGANCWLTGPGELYAWNFEGVGNGFSGIETVDIFLYDPDANLLADVTLRPTHVFVGDGTGVPASPFETIALEVHPNPFNPKTTLSFGGPEGAARLAVYDLAGREIGLLWSGELGEGRILESRWDGTNEAGEVQASGVYFFRLETESGEQLTKRAVLLK